MKAIVQSYDSDSGKAVLQTCIPFIELMAIARFTARTRPEEDPYGIAQQEYQRELNIKHVNEIVDYIEKAINSKTSNNIALFPTSMLVAFNYDDMISMDEDMITDLSLPESCYVVDGQHRLKAMMTLYDKCTKASLLDSDRFIDISMYLLNFKFNCTILLNFDIWEQAKVFADVNFKQKKVNKSLYYDIYGAFHPENSEDYKQNVIYLAHSLVEYLNVSPKSPLQGAVRMLGNGQGVISQAFLVEALLRHISSPRGIWYFDPMYQPVDKSVLNPMKWELFSYLNVLKYTFNAIWESSEYIIRKTTGLGALLKLMGYLHKKLEISIDEEFNKVGEIFICSEYVSKITPYILEIKKYEKELFSSKEGNFSGSGGKGLEASLYKRMVEIVDNLK